MKESATLSIDLCPYTIDMCRNGIRILDIGGSVLKKLDNRRSTTHNRFSEDRCCTKIGTSWCTVEYEMVEDLECLRIVPMKGHKVPKFTELVDWVSVNFDRIQSIGWEMLEKP